MKLHNRITLLLIIALLLSAPVYGAAGRLNVGVTVNNAAVQFPDAAPYLDTAANRVLVPVRFVSESLGAQVAWDGATRTVTVTKGADTVVLTIDRAAVTKNGGAFELDAPARIESSRTYVPLRFISEAFGAKVEWSQTTKIVYITTAEAVDTAMSPEFASLIAQYPNNAVIGGRRNSLLFAVNGQPGIYNADIIISTEDNLLGMHNSKPATLDALQDILQIYYPTDYQRAYDAVVSLKVGIATPEMTLDGRYFAAKRFEDGYNIHLGR